MSKRSETGDSPRFAAASLNDFGDSAAAQYKDLLGRIHDKLGPERAQEYHDRVLEGLTPDAQAKLAYYGVNPKTVAEHDVANKELNPYEQLVAQGLVNPADAVSDRDLIQQTDLDALSEQLGTEMVPAAEKNTPSDNSRPALDLSTADGQREMADVLRETWGEINTIYERDGLQGLIDEYGPSVKDSVREFGDYVSNPGNRDEIAKNVNEVVLGFDPKNPPNLAEMGIEGVVAAMGTKRLRGAGKGLNKLLGHVAEKKLAQRGWDMPPAQRAKSGLSTPPEIPSSPEANIERGHRAMGEVLASGKANYAAMHRKDLGWIAFEPGEVHITAKGRIKGGGFKKIAAKHPEDMAKLPEVIERGKISFFNLKRNRRSAEVDHGGYKTVFRLNMHGDRETWVLTHYIDKGGKNLLEE